MLFILIPILFVFVVFSFMQRPQFGSTARGKRLELIRKSPQYRKGAFNNISYTPNFTDGATYGSVLREVLFGKKVRLKPETALPGQKTDLRALDPAENVLVWFGHSSYFMQLDGKKILVDPVFSGAASPIRFTMPSFPGSDLYTVDDLPDIDFLFLTHDHWDHLDYQTIVKLKNKASQVVCSLGTGAHLERWGYDPAKVTELDWHETATLKDGFTARAVPARHFAGRGFARNKALWSSFVLQSPGMRIYIGGDSGYDTHFADIGEKYGPFDLAILECGQYNKNWKHIHMMPEEVPQAALDLKARRLLPVHWGKFALSNHPWDEPITRVSEASKKLGVPMLHPMIGEKVRLKEDSQVFSAWWR